MILPLAQVLVPLRTQKEVARNLGITPQAVAALERSAWRKIQKGIRFLAAQMDTRNQPKTLHTMKPGAGNDLDPELSAKLERMRAETAARQLAGLERKRRARQRRKRGNGHWWLTQATIAAAGREQLPPGDRE